MVDSSYVPSRGDVIWLSFNPQMGHEQAGRRPGLILSPLSYNKKSGLAIVCPITSQIKKWGFEVLLPQNLGVSGVVLSDHVNSLDWRSRHAEWICAVPHETVAEVLDKVQLLLTI